MDSAVSVRLATKARSVSEMLTTVAAVRVSTARVASTPSMTSDASVMSVSRACFARQTSMTVQARLVATAPRAMTWSPSSHVTARPASLGGCVATLSRRAAPTCPSASVAVSTVPLAFCCLTAATAVTASLATRDTIAAKCWVRRLRHCR